MGKIFFGDDILKEMHNCNSNNNADNEFMDKHAQNERENKFSVPIDIAATAWDRTPDTSEEMVNAYGTYEIQPTSDTDYPFPAISQGLPSEEVEHRPEHFHEGLVPKLNE